MPQDSTELMGKNRAHLNLPISISYPILSVLQLIILSNTPKLCHLSGFSTVPPYDTPVLASKHRRKTRSPQTSTAAVKQLALRLMGRRRTGRDGVSHRPVAVQSRTGAENRWHNPDAANTRRVLSTLHSETERRL